MHSKFPWLVLGLSTAAMFGCAAHEDEESELDTDSAGLTGTISGTYRLQAQHSMACLRAGSTSVAGASIIPGACDAGALEFSEPLSGTGIAIRLKDTSLCLSVEGRGLSNGVRILPEACNGSTAQQFVPTRVSGRVRSFKSVLSGRCVDMSLSKSVLHQWDCHGNTNQRFAALATTTTAPSTALRFPRLGGMLIGNPKNYDEPAYQAQVAKLDFAVLGMYEGWRRNGKTPLQATNEIRARNPAIRLANYTIMTEVSQVETTTNATVRAKLSNEHGPNGIGDWWAYDKDGNHSDWNNGQYNTWDTNLTLLTRPDANGDRWPQWKARYDYDALIKSYGVDAWYCDNNFWRPRVDADWNRDGVTDSRDDIKVRNWFRDGQRAYYERARAIAPNQKLMVNADSDLSGESSSSVDDFTQFTNVVHTAFVEHAIGASWSTETWAGFNVLLEKYRALSGNVLERGGVMLDTLLTSTTDYKTLRYAFGLTLLNDGYFAVSTLVNGSTNYNKIPWFDEYDLAGRGTTKWLGAAIDAPPTAPSQNGVWRRRFENGMVLVNPKGNGTRTVTIEAGYKRIAGVQAPTVNNGARTTSVTLADRDGLLLVAE